MLASPWKRVGLTVITLIGIVGALLMVRNYILHKVNVQSAVPIFTKLNYTDQFPLQIINEKPNAYLLRVIVDATQIQYSTLSFGNLQIAAWINGSYVDRVGTLQQVVIPLTYFNRQTGQYYLVGLPFDENSYTPYLNPRFLAKNFQQYLTSPNQIVGAYFDPDDSIAPGLQSFLAPSLKEYGFLPETFIQTGNPSSLPTILGASDHLFLITSLGADIH